MASSNSRRGKLAESAITASERSPKTSCATHAKNAESTPPEYATTHDPNDRINSRNCSNFASDTARTLPPNRTLVEALGSGLPALLSVPPRERPSDLQPQTLNLKPSWNVPHQNQKPP